MAVTVPYERDTEVIDVDIEEPEGGPYRQLHSERKDAELTMQVRHDDGKWHRMMPDRTETTCGAPLFRLGLQPRHHSLAGLLCEVCHTPRELAKSAEINAAVLKSVT